MGVASLSPDGRTLATWDGVGIRLWDVATGQLKATLPEAAGAVDHLSFSPDGMTLAAGSYPRGPVPLWDVTSGQLKATLTGWLVSEAGSPDFSPDSHTLVSASGDVTLRLWDAASGRLKATLTDDAWFPLAFSPDSQTLATGGLPYNSITKLYAAQLWDVASGQLKATLPDVLFSPLGSISAQLAFSADSKTLATASRNGLDGLWSDPSFWTVQLWDAASRQRKAPLKGATGPLAFSPDGKTLATGSYDATTKSSTVQLWDVASGQLKTTLKDAVGLPTFSPDSKTLATWNYSATTQQWMVQLWDAASGQLRATLTDTAILNGVPQFAFSPDSKTLARRDGSGHLHLWDVTPASPLPITAQTSLSQFPPWLTHPFYWRQGEPGVSLLDPVDEHVLATMQALSDAPASLYCPPPDPAAAPPTGGNWITTTPDGYFDGSANLAQFIRWNMDGMLYPAAAYWDVYYRPDLVRQALRTPGE